MRYLSFVAGVIVALSSTPSSAQQIPDKVQPQPVTLTGCVAAGEKANTYVLTHITSSADAVGTTGSSGVPIYWLDPPSKLKGHVGHKVEVSGTLQSDVDKTKVKEKDGAVELKADGKTVKVPENSTAANALPAKDAKGPGYKVKVKSVKMISEACNAGL